MTAVSQSMLQGGPETALEAALAHAGLDPSISPSGTDPLTQPWGHMTSRFAVVSGDCIRLILSNDTCAVANIILGPADCIGLCADLMAAARLRVGR
jgi:hypothetical protein